MAKKKPKTPRARAVPPRKRRRTTPALRQDVALPRDGGDGEALYQPAPVAEESLLPFGVVAVGASAGGLEAFNQFLEKLPPDTGMAIVIIQHLAPGQETSLFELLSRRTAIPVQHVTEPTTLKPNRLYVVPSNTVFARREGGVALVTRSSEHPGLAAVDALFQTLAETAASRSIAVVLTGSSADGSAGLREVKAAGGITFAQSPETAKYDRMPRSAIATGLVDAVLSPGDIAAELGRIGKHSYVCLMPAAAEEDGAGMDGAQLEDVFKLLRSATGLDFRQYKQPTINRRLLRRMALRKIETLDQYVGLLRREPEEVEHLFQDILIQVTRFFRDADAFAALREHVFPRFDGRIGDASPIRAWTPGCATGEETYSVAMALLDYLGDRVNSTTVQIFGTDVSERAIDKARAGVYSESISADVPGETLRRYFTRVDSQYRAIKSVRDLCVFARQDITRDPPFSRLDLIVCRNVLIYLNPQLQHRVLGVFQYALKPNGVLMLGGAESIGPYADLFTAIDKKHRLYAKMPGGIWPEHRAPFEHRATPMERLGKLSPEDRPRLSIQNLTDRLILDRFAPSGVVVDKDMQIIQFRGRTGRFLEPPVGDASLNLMRMAHPSLVGHLRRTLQEAKTKGVPVRKEGIPLDADGEHGEVAIDIMPLKDFGGGGHYLVLFEESKPTKKGRRTPAGGRRPAREPAGTKDRRISQIEHELSTTREYLQSVIQDFEAANEELQSANEEILSSNEELQSTNEELDTAKEELQSTNEEINSVNDELQARNDELSRANSDLANLLRSVEIPILMVSGDLRVRRFTPLAEKVLNLIPGDVGRPVSHIKPNIDCPDIAELCAEVIDTMGVCERDVQDKGGNWFSMRIRPYKTAENRIDGAVVVFVNITEVRQQTLDLTHTRDYAQAIIETIPTPLVVLEGDLRVRDVNRAFCEAFHAESRGTVGRLLYDLGSGQWDIPKLRVLLGDILPQSGSFEGFEVEHEFPGIGRRKMFLNARRLAATDPGNELILLAIEDRTNWVQQ